MQFLGKAVEPLPPLKDKIRVQQIGWLGQTGEVYRLDEPPTAHTEPGSFGPLYIEWSQDD